MLGEVVCRIISVSMACLAGCILLFVYVFYGRQFQKRNRVYMVGVVFFFLGVFCLHNWQKMLEITTLSDGTNVNFSGNVLKREESEYGVTYVMKASSLEQKSTSIRLELKLEPEEALILGTKLEGQGVVSAFGKATNPGGYDEKSYQMGNGILLALDDVVLMQAHPPIIPWREWLYRFRSTLSQIFESVFEEANASLAVAMVLGDKTGLDSEIKELYQKNGIAHLIAISGLHIAMIGGSLYRMLRKMTGSYPIAAVVGVGFILSYGVMTGLSGATVRAIIMLITSIGADVFGRRYDGLSAIAFALLLMLISNPYQLTQVGFQLSFGAVIGIALIQPLWKLYIPKIPKVFDGLCVSISVQLVLTPIMLYYFYEIPVYSILVNVIVVPIMSFLLGALLLCGSVGLFSIKLATIPAFIANFIFELYEEICKISECLPGHTLCTGNVKPAWIILYYILLGGAMWLLYQRKKKLALGAGFVLILLFVVLYLPTRLMVCMFDVGQGDGIYIRTPNRTHILVDGGSSTKNKVGKYVLKNGLKYYGVEALDYVFVSHSDSDHYSGIKELLEEDWIDIKCVVFPAVTNPDESYQELVSLSRNRGCQIYYMKKDDVLEVSGVRFYCLSPLEQAYEDKNAGSIVLHMSYGEFDMLFTGDLTAEEELKIINDIEDKLEILKVAHHGSATSTSASFLESLRPVVACVSVGEKNRYGHPAKEVMERLKLFAEKIYLTKDNGAITIETDGNVYEVHTFLD